MPRRGHFWTGCRPAGTLGGHLGRKRKTHSTISILFVHCSYLGRAGVWIPVNFCSTAKRALCYATRFRPFPRENKQKQSIVFLLFFSNREGIITRQVSPCKTCKQEGLNLVSALFPVKKPPLLPSSARDSCCPQRIFEKQKVSSVPGYESTR